jgi:hypothetical protein
MAKTPHLLTYPRSASHYFDKLLYKKMNFHIERSHAVNGLFDQNNNKIRKIITIARDPRESISSYIALEKYFNPDKPSFFREKVTEYILLYNFLYEHADCVIDYKDLMNKPDIVIEKVLDILNINKDNYTDFITNIDYNSNRFLESSKSLAEYSEINKELDNYNIELCYFYYNRLLERKILL